MLRAVSITIATALSLAFGIVTYTKIAARTLSGTPPTMLAPELQADMILVDKSDRKLSLLRGEDLLASYPIALGGNADAGKKQFEGDKRTPEGTYQIDWRNEHSVAYLSLHISYPNGEDQAAATASGQSAGGNIMIHGLPNGWGFIGAAHIAFDWTNGCIGVDNNAMQDIWSRVPNGTRIEIRP